MPWVWTRVESTPLESLATALLLLSVTGAQAKGYTSSTVPREVGRSSGDAIPEAAAQLCPGTQLTPTKGGGPDKEGALPDWVRRGSYQYHQEIKGGRDNVSRRLGL